jgi:death-on-curing family protein
MKKKKLTEQKQVILYQTPEGNIEFRGDVKHETLWATQAQMAEAFGVTPQNITLHLKNIYSEKELSEKATCKETLQVQIEGNRSVKRTVKEYNLDVIISVGYRISSVSGTKFRQWATKTLKQHLIDGYTINKKRIKYNLDKFQRAVVDVQKLLPVGNVISNADILELVKSFAGAWFSIESYDEEKFPKSGTTKKSVQIQVTDLYDAVATFKIELQKKGQASDLFAQEKTRESLAGILGNVMQSAFGREMYGTVEEKAAHLLYFIIKNHPFNDGNKRTGAFSFIWFLRKSGIAFRHKITPEALTAITLLVAESKSGDKDRIIGIILLLLNK